MVYDIRKVCSYFNNIHSRYYVDTNGIIYTSLSSHTNKIMIDGKYYNINGFRKSNLSIMNNTNKMLISIPFSNKYFLLNDGTILQRLYTRLDDTDRVDVSLISLDGKCNRYKVHRIVAGVFIGDITNKEVHHIDGNHYNNKVSNLQIMITEEHREKVIV